MNNVKRKKYRQQKRHEKQLWKNQTYREIQEENLRENEEVLPKKGS